MLLKSLPRLPFVCAFDILFRHGGIADGLQRIFTSGTELFEFMETVFGNGIFNETVRACHLVLRLGCPANALYLLHPVDKTIPESMGAWSVAAGHSDAYWILPVRRDLMIQAVRMFLPHGPVYDWLHSTDFTTKRTMQLWVEFALEFIYNHRFTARWWREHEWWESETMGIAILKKVEEEEKRLERSLWNDECRQMMKVKMDKRAMQLELEEEQSNGDKPKSLKSAKEQSNGDKPKSLKSAKEQSNGDKPKSLKSAKEQSNRDTMKSLKSSQKKRPSVLRLTDSEIECARIDAGQLLIKHKNLLKTVRSILNKQISTHTFDSNLPEIARLVMALIGKEFRKSRWTLKAAFHQAAGDRLGLETWHIERELCRQEHYPVDNALEKLRKLR
jgi:hypothetical protein